MIAAIAFIIIGYIIGSIPTGYLVARALGIEDIRSHGSGNIGATNVARILGFKYFFVVLCLDFFKAYFYLIGVQAYSASECVIFLVALALFFGNIASLFLQFQGGRGIATGAGIMCAIAPGTIALAFVPWILLFALTHTVGIASIGALCALPLCALILQGQSFLVVALSCILSVVGLYRHRTHIISVIKNLTAV